MVKLEKFKTPWEEKIPKAYFLGLVTGKIYTDDNVYYANRLKLVIDASEHLDKIDAAFCGNWPGLDWIKETLP